MRTTQEMMPAMAARRRLRATSSHLRNRAPAQPRACAEATAATTTVDAQHAPSLQRHGSRDPIDPSIPQLSTEMSNAALRAQFEAEGFVHVKGLLTPEEAAEMERELVHFIDDLLPTSSVGAYYHDASDPRSVFQIDTMADHPYFDRLMNGARGQSKINDVVEVLFGERAVGLVHFFDRIPGEEGQHDTPPHQDAAYSSQLCTAWVAVDPADEENGCMRYSIGSHLRSFPGMPAGNGGGIRGSRPHPEGVPGFGQAMKPDDYREEDREHERAMVASPGDLIIHHPLTVHRADANKTTPAAPRSRRAVGCSYFGAQDREEYERINENMHQHDRSAGAPQPTADNTKPRERLV